MKIKNSTWGFTIIEMLLVISIVIILLGTIINSLDTQWAKDTQRIANTKVIQWHLQQFKQDYWIYPNSASTWRKYPSSWCSVTWYESLIACFVSEEIMKEETDDYEKLAFDPSEWEKNTEWETYDVYYWIANNGNQYKLCFLAWKQEKATWYVDLTWIETIKWKRYWCVVSPNTAQVDVTSMAK
jgi:type II secretory pathway pseudopilin PulG